MDNKDVHVKVTPMVLIFQTDRLQPTVQVQIRVHQEEQFDQPTVQVQIRVHQEEQFDQGLHCWQSP